MADKTLNDLLTKIISTSKGGEVPVKKGTFASGEETGRWYPAHPTLGGAHNSFSVQPFQIGKIVFLRFTIASVHNWTGGENSTEDSVALNIEGVDKPTVSAPEQDTIYNFHSYVINTTTLDPVMIKLTYRTDGTLQLSCFGYSTEVIVGIPTPNTSTDPNAETYEDEVKKLTPNIANFTSCMTYIVED